MNIPEKLFYTVEHEWIDFHQDEVTIGITDYAQSQLGDVIFVEFPKVGDIFSAGDPFGEIEAVKTVSDLYAPVSGTVIAVNENIENEPESVNSDPYGKGWLIKVQYSRPEEKPDLLSSAAYEELVS